MEITSFTLDQQKEQINDVIKQLKLLGVDATRKQSRYQKEYNALEIKTSLDLNKFFNELGYDVDILDTPKEIVRIISGKYIAKTIVDAKGKFAFYCVNTYTEKGSIKTKELSPDNLKLAGVKFTSVQSFKSKVSDGIENASVDNTVKSFMRSLFDLAEKSSAKSINFDQKTKELYSLIKPQDIQAIGKDFGEILSLRWTLNQKEFSGFTSFGFPSISNEPLVDYSLFINFNDKEIRIEFSAKFEQGAAPSIKAIVNNIDKTYKNPTQSELKYINVLKSLSEKGVSNNIVNAMMAIDSSAYQELGKIIGNRKPNIDMIEQFIMTNVSKKFETVEARVSEFKRLFSKFYSLLGKNVTDESLNVVFNNKTYSKGVFSPIVSAMGYALVEIMNNDKDFSNVLNTIARDIEVQQVYLDIDKTSMSFEIKKFSDAKFTFSYGANAKDSSNTGIKFKMVRNGKTTEVENK